MLVELACVVANSLVAATANVGNDVGNCAIDSGVILVGNGQQVVDLSEIKSGTEINDSHKTVINHNSPPKSGGVSARICVSQIRAQTGWFKAFPYDTAV